MHASALSEAELTKATLTELFTHSERGVKLHCLGTVATALGGLGIVASLDDGVGAWPRIAVWAGLVLLAAAVLYRTLVWNRTIPTRLGTVDAPLVSCAVSGLLVGSIGWFDLASMRHDSFAYALSAATLAYCVGTLVNLHPLSFLIGASIVPAAVSLSLSLFVTGNVVPGICVLVVLGLFVQALAPMRRTVDELVRSRLIAEHASAYDPLTDVRNRSGLAPVLATARGLVYGDIDDFKLINDRFGHATGDAVIKELALRLVSAAEPHNAVVARVGGDEFVMVVESLDTNTMQFLARDIALAVAKPFEGVGKVGFSLGTATRADFSEGTLQRLFDTADQGLYAAKLGRRTGGDDQRGYPVLDIDRLNQREEKPSPANF